MATKVIQWNEGTGNISLTYTGQGDGTIVVSSDQNNLSVARSQQITVKTTDGSKSQTVTIRQAAYVRNYLKFTALESGTFTLTIPSGVTSSHLASISYSLDNGATWTTTANDSTDITITTPTVAQGGTVLWKGSGVQMAYNANSGYYSTFSSTGDFQASGNIMSLLYEDDFEDKLTISKINCFSKLFLDCEGITTPPTLPATSLWNGCYSDMFHGCTSLTTAPVLPATTLKNNCYQSMFYGCTSLTTLPSNMLPATTLYQYCYQNMFYGCTALTTTPNLPATTAAVRSCDSMFSNCTSLTSIPTLSITTTASYCCANMFSGCSSLITIPSNMLPATTLTSNCYNSMFKGCTSLTSISLIIHGTTLASGCYMEMFRNCTSLTTVPVNLLPVTTLQSQCYRNMFYDCKSLTVAPDLPAPISTTYCYGGMFRYTKVNSIKCLLTDLSAQGCVDSWLYGALSSGTFYKDANTTWPTGFSGIPTGWTVVDVND